MKDSFASIAPHKSGSTVLNQYLKLCAAQNGVGIYDVAVEGWKSESCTESDYCIEYPFDLPTPHYYGCFRGLYVNDMPRLADLTLIVQLRNPLDCLVSMYYSYSKTHSPGNAKNAKEMIKMKEQIASMGIDEFVMSKASQYVLRLNGINELINSSPNRVLVLKYEDMVLCNQEWQSCIKDFLRIAAIDASALLSRGIDFSIPSKENLNSHKRRVTPGDYLSKLNQVTISKLTKVFSTNLNCKFDYFE